MEKIVYFSGSHGSGKSTLIEKIKEREPDLFILHQKRQIPKKHNPYERAKLRTVRHYLHVWDAKKISEKNPDKIVLVDRCIYDDIIYMGAFFKLGWITQEQLDEYYALKRILFTEEIKPKNVIFVCSSLEQAIEHIKKRWAETNHVKWREEKFYYLSEVMESAKKFYQEMDVLKVTAPDLNERVDLCMDWINERVKSRLQRNVVPP